MASITDIERKLQELRDKSSRAKGRLEQVMKELKKEFQVDTIDEAEALLQKTRKELEKLEKRCDVELTKFEENWGIKLGKMG